MKKNSKWGPFLAGMLAGAMLLGCGTAALAANAGGVSFGKMELKVMGKTAVAAGETATNAAGCQIPSTLLYTDETGGGTTYVPLRTFSELLEIPLDWENDTIYLGGKPGKVEVNFDAQGPDPVSANRPKTQVGAKAGPYTEVEPYWPEKEEILGTFEEDTRVIASSGAGGSATTDPYKGGDISISITNNTQWSLRFTVRSPHIFSTQDDVLPSTIIPAGETVIRTFHAGEYDGWLYQQGLVYRVNFDGAMPPSPDSKVDVTISAVHF